jgi:hypothetical protein
MARNIAECSQCSIDERALRWYEQPQQLDFFLIDNICTIAEEQSCGSGETFVGFKGAVLRDHMNCLSN